MSSNIDKKGRFKKNCIPWNKGLTKETDKRVMKYSKSLTSNKKISENSKRMWQNPEYRDMMIKMLDDRKEIQAKICKRDSTKISDGRKNSLKWITSNQSSEHREKMSRITKKTWENPEYKKKTVHAILAAQNIKPNKPETILLNTLNDLFPNEYVFVGDGSLIIEGKCPDFVNINGQKKLIEHWGDYWHKGENEQERIDLFAKYGWSTLIIWEKELSNREDLIEKLQSFHNGVFA